MITVWSHPTTSHPTPSNSGCRPRRKVKHWTPKGDCNVTGNEGRNHSNFIKGISLKVNDRNKLKPLNPLSTSYPIDYERNSFQIYSEQF